MASQCDEIETCCAVLLVRVLPVKVLEVPLRGRRDGVVPCRVDS